MDGWMMTEDRCGERESSRGEIISGSQTNVCQWRSFVGNGPWTPGTVRYHVWELQRRDDGMIVRSEEVEGGGFCK